MQPYVFRARAISRVRTAFAVLVLVATSVPAAAEQDALIFGANRVNNRLVRFFSNAPGTIVSDIAITGLLSGEAIVSIDFRPATGELYGLAAAGTVARLVKIDPVSGALLQVGVTGAFSLDNGANGMAFNPVPDRIRIVSTANGNKRINPNDGTLAATDTTLAYVAGDVNAGQVPGVSTIAYTNHYLGATTTTVYAIDSGVAALARLGSANGSPLSPNSGQLTTIASLGFPPSSSLGGMTIQPGTNTAYAAIQVAGVSTLYMVHLNTGATTLIGAIGSGTAIGGIAIAPASPCLDIDGDGRIDALSDGLVLLRALFGLSGAAATNAAVPATSPRSDWPAIRNHLNANCGLHLAP